MTIRSAAFPFSFCFSLAAVASLGACGGKTTADAEVHEQLVDRLNAATCAQAKPTTIVTMAAMDALAHTWVACDDAAASKLLNTASIAGFQIDANGVYSTIDVDSNGAYVERSGFLDEATATLSPLGDHVQLSLTYFDKSMLPLEYGMSADGSTLDVYDYWGTPVRFVATDAKVAPPALPPPGASLGAEGCGQPEGDLLPVTASASDTKAAIIGKWVQCTGAPKPESHEFGPDGNAGIEIDADGTWAFLAADHTKGPSDGWSGTWQLVGIGAEQDAAPFQLNLVAGSGTYALEYAVANAPRKLRLSNGYGSIYSAMP